MDKETSAFSLFVYGTLKRGHPAHDRLCGGAVEIEEEAVARGALHDLPAGYPALEVPKGAILAVGADDALSDARTQAEAAIPQRGEPGPGEAVHGEILTFEDAGSRLPILDAFEGFEPGGASLYVRVLIPAWTNSGTPLAVWAYVMESPPGVRLPGGRWPP